MEIKNEKHISSIVKADLNYGIPDSHRMWAAISFAVMLIVIGIPLWWKTTEVHRATLPYEDIHKLNPTKVNIGMTIFIYTEYPTRTNDILQWLQHILNDIHTYSINFKPLKVDVNNVTYEINEDMKSLHPSPGNLLLIEVSKLDQDVDIFISNKRTIYFKKETSPDSLSLLIKEMLHDEFLHSKILSIISPEQLSLHSKESNRIRASLSYDIVFTIINSDPEHLFMKWNVKNNIKKYIQPLFDQISQISEHRIKSQWLYLVDIGENPKKDGDDWFLSYSQLPHIITPFEKKLGSGISKNPTLHMILYVANCLMSPLKFVSETGERLNAMISPQWGAVQILNPDLNNCNNKTEIIPDTRQIMAVFTSQFQTLLGVRNEFNVPKVKIDNIKGALLRSWELDSLYRMRTVEQLTTASLTLQSLSKLLGEISNIVINEDVADAINEAVGYINKATQSLKQGNLKKALDLSKIAFSASERAFSDPTLLALLYFPDDQKYAVYIPLFLPIMIPVLMSLKKIHSWLFSRKGRTHEKQD